MKDRVILYFLLMLQQRAIKTHPLNTIHTIPHKLILNRYHKIKRNESITQSMIIKDDKKEGYLIENDIILSKITQRKARRDYVKSYRC